MNRLKLTAYTRILLEPCVVVDNIKIVETRTTMLICLYLYVISHSQQLLQFIVLHIGIFADDLKARLGKRVSTEVDIARLCA